MKRSHYRNGDEITLACGCDGCNPAVINGVLCHEQGCPEAWRDQPLECFECGCEFFPSVRWPRGLRPVCHDCQEQACEDDWADMLAGAFSDDDNL